LTSLHDLSLKDFRNIKLLADKTLDNSDLVRDVDLSEDPFKVPLQDKLAAI